MKNIRKLPYSLGLLSAIALGISSCSSENDVLPVKTPPQNVSAFRITPEEAAERAVKLMSSLNDEQLTRSNALRVKSVEPFYGTTTLTRGNAELMNDTLLYLVNFEDDGGFAIMGANRKVLPVYAISDEGSFTKPIDESDCVALDMILDGIVADAAARINFPLDTTGLNIGKDPDLDVDVLTGFRVESKPWLSYAQSHVGQNAPYNKYVSTFDGRPAMTGCGAISVEQIMSFHKWPESYKDYTFNWREMNNGETDQIATLLYFLGLEENLDMTYFGLEAPAIAYTHRFVPTFKNFGYTTSPDFISFFNNENRARNSLKKEPILMYAQHLFEDGSIGGHFWVIDGSVKYYSDEFDHSEANLEKYLYHCVWGWDGSCNGYYYVADAKAFSGYADEKHKYDDAGDKWVQNVELERRIMFIDNIKPNK